MKKTLFLAICKIRVADSLTRWEGVKSPLQAPQTLVLPSESKKVRVAEIAVRVADFRGLYEV